MLYKLAHIIKDKFSFLWEAIEWGNASLFYMLHKKQLAKVNKILEGISPKYIIRLATNNDVDILVHFFREQPEGAFKFFRPHEFDEKAVRKFTQDDFEMKKLLLPLLLAAFAVGVSSCSDDKIPGDPEGTVTLNMMDESNGKTMLDDSGIYIDKAQNFVSGDNCVLFALGKVGGLGAVAPKSLVTGASAAAVQAGHGYVAVRPGVLMSFPSGKHAMPIGGQKMNYLKIYVVSPLTEESRTVGAAIRYVTDLPKPYKLPEYGSTVLRIDRSNYDHLEQEVSLSLPAGDVEHVFDDDGYAIECERRGGKLVFRLGDWFSNRFELFLRINESYTRVYVEADVPL